MRAGKAQGYMFDTHRHIKQLQTQGGFKEKQAISHATKTDPANLNSELRSEISQLRLEIKRIKFDILKWVIPFLIAIMIEIWFKG